MFETIVFDRMIATLGYKYFYSSHETFCLQKLTPIRESWKKIQKPGTEQASFLEKNQTKIQKTNFGNVWERHFWKKNPDFFHDFWTWS